MSIKIKLLFIFFTLSLATININAQSNKKYAYYLNGKLESTAPNKATIYGEGSYKDGSFEIKCYDKYLSQLLVTLHCIDSSLSNLDGLYTVFHLNGNKEEEGTYKESEKIGTWQKWDSTEKKTDSIIFKDGYPIFTTSYLYREDGKISRLSIKDSLKDTYLVQFFDSTTNLDNEVFFNGKKGERKTYLINGIAKDSLFSREEIESKYPGGEIGWTNFLRRNLNPQIPSENKAPPNRYTLIINFTVEKDGKLTNILSENKQGYGMDEHDIKIIKQSGDWIPGSQFGIKVKSIKRQPIVFEVSEF